VKIHSELELSGSRSDGPENAHFSAAARLAWYAAPRKFAECAVADGE
jgi:hypothetical protein